MKAINVIENNLTLISFVDEAFVFNFARKLTKRCPHEISKIRNIFIYCTKYLKLEIFSSNVLTLVQYIMIVCSRSKKPRHTRRDYN